MKIINKYNNEKLKVIGTDKSKIDGRLLLIIKGWKKNERLEMNSAITEDGRELTEAMFEINKPVDPLQVMKAEILTINNLSKYNHSNSGDILSKNAQEIISEIQIKAGGKGLTHLRNSKFTETAPNDFVASIADSVMKYGKCSEKQAYVLAKYAIDNNIHII